MRLRLVVAFVAALFAFLGWNGGISAARAAQDSVATSGTAQPGTYASRHGAPLCDERAASSYAAEPAAPIVDGGEVDSTPFRECASASKLSAGVPTPDRGDDLHRTSPMPHEVATLPPSLDVQFSVSVEALPRVSLLADPRDGYARGDYIPPRPVPWIR